MQRKRLTEEIIVNNVNNWGKHYPEELQFKFIRQVSKGNCFKVVVKNIKSHNIKEVVYKDLKRYNPFRIKKQTDNDIIKRVNKLGKKSEDPYLYKEHFRKKGILYVSVKHCLKNKIKTLTIKELSRITNPFTRKIKNLEREQFHPKIKETFKSESLKFKSEFLFYNGIKRLYADFKVYNEKGEFIIVEAKHDYTSHGTNMKRTYSQVDRYHNTLLKDKKYRGIIAISSHGKKCYSLDEAIAFIKKHL